MLLDENSKDPGVYVVDPSIDRSFGSAASNPLLPFDLKTLKSDAKRQEKLRRAKLFAEESLKVKGVVGLDLLKRYTFAFRFDSRQLVIGSSVEKLKTKFPGYQWSEGQVQPDGTINTAGKAAIVSFEGVSTFNPKVDPVSTPLAASWESFGYSVKSLLEGRKEPARMVYKDGMFQAYYVSDSVALNLPIRSVRDYAETTIIWDGPSGKIYFDKGPQPTDKGLSRLLGIPLFVRDRELCFVPGSYFGYRTELPSGISTAVVRSIGDVKASALIDLVKNVEKPSAENVNTFLALSKLLGKDVNVSLSSTSGRTEDSELNLGFDGVRIYQRRYFSVED